MESVSPLLLLVPAALYAVWFIITARRLSGPRLWPLLGSLPGLIQNCHRLHDWISENLRATSGTYQTTLCAVPSFAFQRSLVTVTCKPKNIEHLLKLRFDNYPKGPKWHSAFHDLLGDGIFNSDGDTWRFQRKTAALEFTTRTLRQAMGKWVSRAIKLRLCPILAAAESGAAAVDLQDLLLRLTFDNICGLTFGEDPETLSSDLHYNPFAAAFDEATEASLHRLIFPAFLWKLQRKLSLGIEAKFPRNLGLIHGYLSKIVEKRKKEVDEDNLLTRFMNKGEYPDQVLRQVALNFILAGRDTSSAGLCWFFWLVMQQPSVEEKIVSEICSVLAETRGRHVAKWVESPIAYEEAERLVYLKAALTEALRLYPPVPEDSKQAAEDDVLPDGTFVPAGSSVTYSIYSLGRMKSVWGCDCMEFRPERWLTEDGRRFEGKQESFKFVAFNGGPRVCLGKELAYLQMKAVAASVLLRHRLSLVPGHRVEQKMSLILFMKNGLLVNVHPRDLRCV